MVTASLSAFRRATGLFCFITAVMVLVGCSGSETEISTSDSAEFAEESFIDTETDSSTDLSSIEQDLPSIRPSSESESTEPGRTPEVEATQLTAAANDSEQQPEEQLSAAPNVDLNKGLIAHWNFEEGKGTKATDSSGNNHHGTLKGPDLSSLWTDDAPPVPFAGKTSVRLHDSKHYVAVPSSASLEFTDAITISGWIKVHSLPKEHRELIKKDSNFSYRLSAGGLFVLGVESPPKKFSSTKPLKSEVPTGQWYHLASRYDGKVMAVYINGILKFEKPHNGLIRASSRDLQIGVQSRFEPSDTSFDDVRIYSRALKDAEIVSLAGKPASSSVHPPKLVAKTPTTKPLPNVGNSGPSKSQAEAAARASIRDIMAISERDLIAIVPTQTPIDCPDPAAGSYLYDLKKRWKWYPKNPHQIVSPIDGTKYPNERFPLKQQVTLLNYKGEKVVCRYWKGPKPKGELRGNRHPERYFFEGAVHKKQHEWLQGQLRKLSDAYRITGDEAIARRIVVILARYAEVYPHYLVSDGNKVNKFYISNGRPQMNKRIPGKIWRPYPHTSGRFWEAWISEINLTFLNGWEAVRASKVVDQLSTERKTNIRALIDRDLVREMVDFVMDMPWDLQMASNLVIYFSRMAQAGRIIGEPEYVHTAYRYLQEFIPLYGKYGPRGAGYTFDLHNPEGTQGHLGVMTGAFATIQSLRGYSDPPGYVGKRDGIHLENFSVEKDLPLFAKMVDVPFAYQMPNGTISPRGDTIGWSEPGHMQAGLVAPPMKRSVSRMLPGVGRAVLGDGSGEQQIQIQMDFSEQAGGHIHKDCLGIIWFAHGLELSGDIGYQRNKLRFWSAQAISHNTVVVDERDQCAKESAFGNVQFFVDSLPGLSALQVDAPGAYDEPQLSRYRRTLALVTSDIEHPYFIDVFEVHGGQQHDYAIHGNLEGLDHGTCSLPLRKMKGNHPLLKPGEAWREPKKMGPIQVYGLFRNVSQAPLKSGATVNFTHRDKPIGTRIHLLMDDADLLLGETPGLRRAGHYNDKAVYDDWMPHMILRRKAGSQLKSTFVAVYEIHSGKPVITSTRRLKTDDNTVAIDIDAGNRTDTFILQLEACKNLSLGNVKTDARLAFAQVGSGRPRLWMVEGTSLAAGSGRVTAPTALVTRQINPIDDDAFQATRQFDSDGTANGNPFLNSWATLVHDAAKGQTHAYPITLPLNRQNANQIKLRVPHGLNFENGNTVEKFSPWRTFKGRGELRIPSAVATTRYAPGQYPFPGPMDQFTNSPDVMLTAKSIPRSALKNGLAWHQIATHDSERETISAGIDDVPIAPAKMLNHRIVKTWDGFLSVEEDGDYTFSITADHGAVLRIGEEQLIDSRYLRRFRPFKAKVGLKSGLHPFHLEHHYRKAYEAPILEIKLNGESLKESQLWHRPQQ